ncbi:MAG: ATP-dependent 6-phosphofructokinase [Anaerolineaceae bacterium]|nr:ATP-dependent 6-phosphofructokinase [Anaerolineaceae bacterium]
MKRIAILTGGGDAPGLNAALRAAVKTAINEYHLEVIGIRNGFDGFLQENGMIPLDQKSVQGILPRGGTILGTANRGNPFAYQIEKDGKTITLDRSAETIDRIQSIGIDALIVIGGDGTLRIGCELWDQGIPVVGIPKTIDNDINLTDFTFGFDTAVNVAVDAFDRLHTTAESHHRVMVLELMGRDAGFIALYAGIAGGADVILIPEIPFHYESIQEKINQRISAGTHFSLIAVSEGAFPYGGEKKYWMQENQVYAGRLGGMAEQIMHTLIEQSGLEVRTTVLGHLQRGGTPTAFDRWLATRFGVAAVNMVVNRQFGRMAALHSNKIDHVSLRDALLEPKRVNTLGDTVNSARCVGISLGD